MTVRGLATSGRAGAAAVLAAAFALAQPPLRAAAGEEPAVVPGQRAVQDNGSGLAEAPFPGDPPPLARYRGRTAAAPSSAGAGPATDGAPGNGAGSVELPAPGAPRRGPSKEGTLYVVATAHLDTQWLWTIQDTIREFVPRTLRDNFALFEKYPDYVFNFEGAFRYMLAKEYDPAEFERLRQYVANGRWRLAGSAIDAGDTNLPAPESLIRHVLYSSRFFRREFGTTSRDLFLPDCFGFGWAYPSVAAHCGVRGFSTQKLSWGSSVGIPFDVGVWEGVDGSTILAALDPGDYVGTIREDLSESGPWLEKARRTGRASGAFVAYHYFGTGDQGGAPDAESVAWLEKSLAGAGPLRVVSASSSQMYDEIPPEQAAKLPRYKGELLMTRHGTGCYTSQAAMKRWNRKNEQLAAAGERASVAADWLGGALYPRRALEEAWTRVLWHHHHDDITGTSTPLAYPFSWNDEAIAANRFAAVTRDAAGAVARALETRGRGEAVVVFNPLSFEREDIVEASLPAPAGSRRAVRVFGPDGRETPSQILSRGGGAIRLLFLARVPSVGFAVYDVRSADRPCNLPTGLSVSPNGVESERYRVRLDAEGDLASILDKRAGRPLLSAPARLQLLEDRPDQWSEWEVSYRDVTAPPREFVAAPARIRMIERGPVRTAVEVSRRAGGSTFVQTIRLSAGGAGETVEIDTRIDWQTPRTLVKAAFPMAVSNRVATYDLGLGTIERGNDHEKLYEVPAQQWADLTASDGRYGVAVLNDCKYGWDKPDDGTLRLTLIHGPHEIEKDRGRHRFVYALAGHEGDWREGRVPELAARLNQPLTAFIAPSHAGPLGRRFSMLALDTAQVAVLALKKAEDSDEIVVRLVELEGKPAKGVHLSLAAPIVSAREMTGAEDPLDDSARAERGGGPLAIEDGVLRLDLLPYRPRTIALTIELSGRLAPPDAPSASPPSSISASRARSMMPATGIAVPIVRRVRATAGNLAGGGVSPASTAETPPSVLRENLLSPPESIPVLLPFDTDVVSLDDDRADGDFDGSGHTLPGELLPDEIASEGIRFVMGPKGHGAPNAVACRGQTIALPHGARGRLYLLAAAAGGDVDASFSLGSARRELTIQEFTGFVGQSQSLVVDGRIVGASRMEEPFLKTAAIAWTGTHRHSARSPRAGDEPYVFCYLFKSAIEIPSGGGTLTLPREPRIRLLAATVADNENDDIVPASDPIDQVASVRIRPKGGLATGPVSVTLSSAWKGSEIRYTLDGDEPSASDRLYRSPLRLSKDTTLRARAFRDGHPSEDVAVRTFTFRTPRPAAAAPRAVPGIAYEYFEGEWKEVGGFASLAPVARGSAPEISLAPRARDLHFGLRFTGYVDVPRDGVYTFYTRSDDGSTLAIDGQLVVDNDGLHGATERSGSIALAAGKHALGVLFFQRGGDLELGVEWEGPGILRQPIPPSAIFRGE